jgi:PKD repeat protein
LQKHPSLMKLFYTTLFLVSVLITPTLVAQQEDRPCAQPEAEEILFNTNPGLKMEALRLTQEFNQFVDEFSSSRTNDDTLYVPVVFHVLHQNGPENVPAEIIHETIAQMNMDYQAENADLGNIHEAFQPLIPVTNILFRLAQKDPDGNCTNGIIRTETPLTDHDGSAFGSAFQWPREMYLNVYVCRTFTGIVAGAAAYSRYPSSVNSSPQSDYIATRYQYLGAGQHTMSHEAGHWMELMHTWGNSNNAGLPGNCSEDDLVEDTPECIGNSGGCNLSFESCGSLDNVQNYMNYSGCATENFTIGQSDRMRAALNSFLADRDNINTPENLIATGILEEPSLCVADFYIEEEGGCAGSEINFIDNSFNGEITSWEWNFEGGTPATSNEQNPTVLYNEGGDFDVTLTVSDGVTSLTTTKENYISIIPVGPPVPYLEIFEEVDELPSADWEVTSDNGLFFDITDEVAAVGTKSVWLRNRIQPSDQTDELISNTINLEGVEEAVITFKYAYAKKTDSNDDILRVHVSRNCGESWVQRKRIRASNGDLVTAPNTPSTDFYPTADQWAEETVTMSLLYHIPTFRFKFEFNSGGGNNVFIDDIKIFDPTTGINQISRSNLDFKVFPNPASNDITLSFNVLETYEVTAELFDLTGRRVETLFSNEFSLGTHTLQHNVSDLKPGVYLIKLSLAGETFTTRLVKE